MKYWPHICPGGKAYDYRKLSVAGCHFGIPTKNLKNVKNVDDDDNNNNNNNRNKKEKKKNCKFLTPTGANCRLTKLDK
jgi:hypothetical protein